MFNLFSTHSRGQQSVMGIAIISILVGVLMLVYYGLYLAAKLVFSPIHSLLVSTVIIFVVFIGVGIYRYKNGAIISSELIGLTEKEPTEIPELERDFSMESTSTIKSEVDELEDSSEDSVTEELDVDIPRDLLVRVLKDDDYTIEDAKREAENQ